MIISLGIDDIYIYIYINIHRLSINFLSRLLQVSPSSRYTTEEAVQHPWISGKFEKIPQTMNEKLVTVVAKETLVAVMRAMFSIAFNSNERPKVQYINKVIIIIITGILG